MTTKDTPEQDQEWDGRIDEPDPDRGFDTPQPNPAGVDPGRPVPDAGSGGADPDHPGLGEGGDQGDGAGAAESDEDVVRRAARMRPSKETGHAGSSADRPPALDPDS